MAEFREAWDGEGPPLLMDERTFEVMAVVWGAPPPDAVSLVPAEAALKRAWDQHSVWAIVPFEALEPRWKVLTKLRFKPTSGVARLN